jgi:hypothetical protein
MDKSREKCLYFINLNPEAQAGNKFRKLAESGEIVVSELLFCDADTPLTMGQVKKGMDLSCYGPDDERCPGFVTK